MIFKQIGIRMALVCVMLLSWGCSTKIQPIKSGKAQLEYKTQMYKELRALPPPKEPIVLVVYKFRDQTGQYKPGTGTTGWSTAVTQGATSMLIKALEDAGEGKWFTILEREALQNLLNERKIIRQTRKQYEGGDGTGNLPPLLFAPIMIEGGIIAYESNLLTGGLGAKYLGIGGDVKYQRDTVTVYLRAVSVKNGRIIKSVTTNKTIFSFALNSSVFKFIGFKDLLEVEAGFTTNEPPQMAVLEAIERAVHSMVIEGAIDGTWNFADKKEGRRMITEYLKEKNANVYAQFDEQGNLLAITKDGRKKRSSKPRTRRQRTSLDVSEVHTGEVYGMVFLRKGTAEEAVSNAQLQLVDARGKVVRQVKSRLGGFYQFASVPLGQYTLRVSPEQVQQLSLKSPPDQRVTLNADEPVLSGMNITIETVPEVEEVSSAITPPQNATAKVESPPIKVKPALSARQYFAETEGSSETPPSENTASRPKPPSPKAEPIVTAKENSPSSKVSTPLSSPDDIRQMGSSLGMYLSQPDTQ